ncbi:MAG: hypothetical protein SFY80_14415, partial [Verrucomicrobiota bacterium]|nr:hypothetical protein [Verrucomicrobiota bacterium]
ATPLGLSGFLHLPGVGLRPTPGFGTESLWDSLEFGQFQCPNGATGCHEIYAKRVQSVVMCSVEFMAFCRTEGAIAPTGQEVIA